MDVEILGVIPARGGSKGVPRKNIYPLAGKPLLSHTIEAAKRSSMLSRVVVSTEDSEIAELAHSERCEVIPRPVELAQDDTPMAPVVRHVLDSLAIKEHYHPEIVVILQPTAPLRRAEHIDESLNFLLERGAASVVSVSTVPGHYHPDWQLLVEDDGGLKTFSGHLLDQLHVRRQDLSLTYTRNGAIYAFRTDKFLENNSLYTSPCLAYIMETDFSVNLDFEEDFWLAEKYLHERESDLKDEDR